MKGILPAIWGYLSLCFQNPFAFEGIPLFPEENTGLLKHLDANARTYFLKQFFAFIVPLFLVPKGFSIAEIIFLSSGFLPKRAFAALAFLEPDLKPDEMDGTLLSGLRNFEQAPSSEFLCRLVHVLGPAMLISPNLSLEKIII